MENEAHNENRPNGKSATKYRSLVLILLLLLAVSIGYIIYLRAELKQSIDAQQVSNSEVVETPTSALPPVAESTPAPTPESTPESAPESTSESAPESTSEPASESTSEPASESTPESTPEPTPEPVDEEGLTASERELFNSVAGSLGHTSLINKRDVPWRPVADTQAISAGPEAGCYGWIVVRDIELDENAFSSDYVELCVAPGVTVTIKGEIPAGKDFHVEKDAKLIIDGNISSKFALCNDGTTIINGTVTVSPQEINLVMNRGTLVVNGTISNTAHIHAFLGSVTEGCTVEEYHDFVPPYECCGGRYGMWAYIHVLLEEEGAKFPL